MYYRFRSRLARRSALVNLRLGLAMSDSQRLFAPFACGRTLLAHDRAANAVIRQRARTQGVFDPIQIA
jgi:hypothetical protein